MSTQQETGPMTASQPVRIFAYEAQTHDGQTLSGTVDAATSEEAAWRLQALHLRIIQIQPADKPPRTKPLRGEDFITFNQQLGQLAAAGLPIEHGLRLIAQDMRSGRLAATVNQLAGELERGVPLAEAMEHHRGQFPPLYGRLLEAGIKTNNLPGMLLNLGRHMELVHRLREVLWRIISYPLIVLVGLMGVLAFLSMAVLPQFRTIFNDFKLSLPALTEMVLAAGDVLPTVLAVVAVTLAGLLAAWLLLRLKGLDQLVFEWLLLPLPLVGAVLRRNLIARWCDALRLGVEAGLDLPAAITLAGDAVGSPRLRRDGQRLVKLIESGSPLNGFAGRMLLPATVPAAIELASNHHDLPTTLHTLSQMYEQQAEMRLGTMPAILMPALIFGVAILISLVIAALFLPLLTVLSAIA